MQEAGLPDFEFTGWFALLVPGTSLPPTYYPTGWKQPATWGRIMPSWRTQRVKAMK
jgi:hypothetical protein